MRTSLRISGGRVEMRTRPAFRCAAYSEEYHPRVAASPGLAIALGLVAIALVVGIGALVLAGRLERSWFLSAKLAALLIAAALGWRAARLQRRLRTPRFYSRTAGREPHWGEIVPDCPRCGSESLTLA